MMSMKNKKKKTPKKKSQINVRKSISKKISTISRKPPTDDPARNKLARILHNT